MSIIKRAIELWIEPAVEVVHDRLPMWSRFVLLSLVIVVSLITITGGALGLYEVASTFTSGSSPQITPSPSLSPTPDARCDISPLDQASVGSDFTVDGSLCTDFPPFHVFVGLKDFFPHGKYWAQCSAVVSEGSFSCPAYGCINHEKYQVIVVVPLTTDAERLMNEWLWNSSRGIDDLPATPADFEVLGGVRVVTVDFSISPKSKHCPNIDTYTPSPLTPTPLPQATPIAAASGS
jgi:hypothetical protein